jgi:hypothetical protein
MLHRRMQKGEVMKEALDRRQALIAGFRGVPPPTERIFQVLEEVQDSFEVQVSNAGQMVWPVLGLKILDQQLKGVAITMDGVKTESPLFVKIGMEEIFEQRREIHECLKAR